MVIKEPLTLENLLQEAKVFSELQASIKERELYGKSDGKSIGTFIEHKFHQHLEQKYQYEKGSFASGIDFPELEIDIKVTSIVQPQSSCPYRDARQKVYGLGYGLLLFVYQKTDDRQGRYTTLQIVHLIYIDKSLTGDYVTTRGIHNIIEHNGNEEDIAAFLQERNLPIDDIQAKKLADEILSNPPKQGYLTISNALQWRLQYGRVIKIAGDIDGLRRLISGG